jgi:hypothetical protein
VPHLRNGGFCCLDFRGLREMKLVGEEQVWVLKEHLVKAVDNRAA